VAAGVAGIFQVVIRIVTLYVPRPGEWDNGLRVRRTR
jgi:hypothetical protein